MSDVEREDNTPGEGPPLPSNGGELERKEVQASDVAVNLESMAITEEDPSNQPEAKENVADAAAPTPELPRLRPACQQLASGAYRINAIGDKLAETITGILPQIGVEEVDELDTKTFYHKYTPAEMNKMLTDIVPNLNGRSDREGKDGKRVTFQKATEGKGNPNNLRWITMLGLPTMDKYRTWRQRDWQERLDSVAANLFLVTGVKLIPVWQPFIVMDMESYCAFSSINTKHGEKAIDITMMKLPAIDAAADEGMGVQIPNTPDLPLLLQDVKVKALTAVYDIGEIGRAHV